MAKKDKFSKSNETNVPMNPDLKAKWLTWLRDPSHVQTMKLLRDDHGFCCLGGLCEVVCPEGHEKLREGHVYYGASSVLPDPAMILSGLKSDPYIIVNKTDMAKLKDLIPAYDWNDSRSSKGRVLLSALNDAGASFTLIADLIEKYL